MEISTSETKLVFNCWSFNPKRGCMFLNVFKIAGLGFFKSLVICVKNIYMVRFPYRNCRSRDSFKKVLDQGISDQYICCFAQWLVCVLLWYNLYVNLGGLDWEWSEKGEMASGVSM